MLSAYFSSLRELICLPWLLYAIHLALFVSLHLCTLVYMFMHEFLCLLVSSSLIPTISCGSVPIFDTRDLESLLGILLNGMCVIHTLISWNYGHPIQTYICPPRNPFLFDNMLVCPLSGFLCNVSLCMISFLFCYLLCLSVGFFFVCCMYMLRARMLIVRAWPPNCEKKGQECKQEDSSPKRAMFSRLGGLASLSGFLSFS